MIRIISDSTGYTCLERVAQVDGHSPLFVSNPKDEFQFVTNLEIFTGSVKSDQFRDSFIDYVLFGNDLLSDLPEISVDDIKPESIDEDYDQQIQIDDMVEKSRYANHIACGNISKFGTYYISKNRCLVVPGDSIKIVTDLNQADAKDIFTEVFSSFNVAYTPLARNMKLKPLKSYRMANITVEYIDDCQLRMSSLEMLAFDGGVLKSLKINGTVFIPALPMINSLNYDKVFSMKSFDRFELSLSKGSGDTKPVIPIDSNKANAEMMLNNFIKYEHFDVPVGKYYKTEQFPLMTATSVAEFMVFTTKKPEIDHLNVYFNCTQFGDQPDGYLYYEDSIDDKLRRFIKRLQDIQYETVSQMMDILLQIRASYVTNIEEYFRNKLLDLKGARKANALRFRIPTISKPIFDTTLRNFEDLNWDYKGEIDEVFSQPLDGPYKAAQSLKDDESLSNKIEEMWRSQIAQYTTHHTSYEYWKNSNSDTKERARFLLDETFSCVIQESYKGTQPQIVIDVEFPHIVKTICLRNRGMEENAQLTRDDLCQLGKNILPMVIKEHYSDDINPYISSVTADVDYDPHHRRAHDWYAFLGAYPPYTEVNNVVRVRYTITFNQLEWKFFPKTKESYDINASFAQAIGCNITNAGLDVIFNSQLEDNLQTKISGDVELSNLAEELMLIFDGVERNSLYLRCGRDYFSPHIANTPFSFIALLNPKYQIDFADAMLGCTININGTQRSIDWIFKKLKLNIQTDRTLLARNYLHLPDTYEKDGTCATLLLANLFSNIKLEAL